MPDLTHEASSNASPRILVLSASVGAGHMRAAQAVELALRESAPNAFVKNVDVLTLTNAAFRKLYGAAYLELVNRAPHVLGYFYDYMDRPRDAKNKRDKLRSAVEKFNMKKFVEVIEDEPWDTIVNTHFLSASIIASLKAEGRVKIPQITATTDFETHRLWVNEPCEAFTTATAEGAAYLQHWGIDITKTAVTGIPIHPVFSKPKDRAACLKNQGLVGDRPIVLQLSGGFGVGPIEQLFRGLLAIEQPLEIITVTGKNEEAKMQLAAIEVPARHRAKVMGFTDQIDELMAVADVVLSKPGGLTTSEVLARGCAMAIVNPIPGQESRNSDYLLENGAAIKINNLGTMSMKLAELLGDKAKLETVKANARKLARPRAAFDVAELAIKHSGASRST